MRIQIEPTEMMVDVDGVRTRIWNGISEDGVKVAVLVHRLVIPPSEDSTAFERELRGVSEPASLQWSAPKPPTDA